MPFLWSVYLWFLSVSNYNILGTVLMPRPLQFFHRAIQFQRLPSRIFIIPCGISVLPSHFPHQPCQAHSMNFISRPQLQLGAMSLLVPPRNMNPSRRSRVCDYQPPRRGYWRSLDQIIKYRMMYLHVSLGEMSCSWYQHRKIRRAERHNPGSRWLKKSVLGGEKSEIMLWFT